MKVIQNPILRGSVFTLGVLSVLLGVIGLFLPIMPTTPFIILAAWCFVRSSPKTHLLLHQNRFLGPPLKSWEKNGAISSQNKIISVALISASAAGMWLRVSNSFIVYIVILFLLLAILFILTRPSS